MNVGVEVNIGIISGAGAGAQDARKNKRHSIMESASLLANCKGNFQFLNAILKFMNNVFKIYPHNPPHYFVSNAMYMVTGAILHNQHLLKEERKKQLLLEALLERSELLGWSIEAWAILNNHYHFIAKAPEKVGTLSKLIRQVHSITAIQLNRWDNASSRQVWFNYWDSCLTYEKSYLARLHYIHMNPVKHGLIDDAFNYPFCSYRWFTEQGDSDLKEQVFKQPTDHLHVVDDF